MFSRSRNPLLTFLLSYNVWVPSIIQVNFLFERYWWFCLVMLRHVTSCHVMSRHATLCHVMLRHVTSCHVMSRRATSCHVRSCHVLPRHVTSCHVMSRQVMSRLTTSCHFMSRRKSRNGHTNTASLPTDFFHTQLIQIRNNRVRWLSWRVPIPYRISGIWSSLCYYYYSYIGVFQK